MTFAVTQSRASPRVVLVWARTPVLRCVPCLITCAAWRNSRQVSTGRSRRRRPEPPDSTPPSFDAESRAVSWNEPAATPSAAHSGHRRPWPTSPHSCSTAVTSPTCPVAPLRRCTGSTDSRCATVRRHRATRTQRPARPPPHPHDPRPAVRRPGHDRRLAGDVASENADRPRPLRWPEATDRCRRLRATRSPDVRAAPSPADRCPALAWPLRDSQTARGHRGKRGQSRRP